MGVGGVLGVKKSMVAHILGKNGNNPCPNASDGALRVVREEKKGTKKRGRGKAQAAAVRVTEGRNKQKGHFSPTFKQP